MHPIRRTLSALALLCALSPVTRAGDGAAMPADTFLYVSWPGLGALNADPDTHLAALLRETGLPSYVGSHWTQVMQAAETADRNMGTVAAGLGSAIALLQHPVQFALGPFRMSGQRPTPRMLLRVEGVEDPATVDALVESVLRLFDQRDVTLHHGDGVTVWCDGPVTDADLVRAGIPRDGVEAAPALAEAERFAAARASAPPAGAFAWFDVRGLITGVEALLVELQAPNTQPFHDVMAALGLDGCEWISCAAGTDGRDWRTALEVRAPAPRRGLLALLEPPAEDDGLPALVPATARFAALLSLDLGAVHQVIGAAAHAVAEDAGREYEGAVAGVSQVLGFDLEADLLATLGPRWLAFTDPRIGGTSLTGMVLVNHLRDAERLSHTLEDLQVAWDIRIRDLLAQEGLPVSMQRITRDGLDLYSVSLPAVAPTLAIVDGNLLVGLHPAVVQGAAAALRSAPEPLASRAAFAELAARLGAGRPASFCWYDLPDAVPELYGQVLLAGQLLSGLVGLAGAEVPPFPAPTLAELEPHCAPLACMVRTDAEGIHVAMQSPFPGAALAIVGNEGPAATVGGMILSELIFIWQIERQFAVQQAIAIQPVPDVIIEEKVKEVGGGDGD